MYSANEHTSVQSVQNFAPCFLTEVWLKRLPDDTAITCEEFPSKSFRIRTLCHVKEVAKMHIIYS